MATEKGDTFWFQDKPKASFRKVNPNAENSIFYK